MDGISRGFILRLPNSCLSRQIFPFSTPREGTPGSLAKPLVVSPLRHCKRRPEDIRSPRFSDSVARPPLVTPSLVRFSPSSSSSQVLFRFDPGTSLPIGFRLVSLLLKIDFYSWFCCDLLVPFQWFWAVASRWLLLWCCWRSFC
ncbi:hypothetical protein KSP39_PZI002944 [Platanthera zijinensis]|uniref:Uncharacterized protein n=1 Tax=Platanthera zijinensis TaxID=2320716 RepID=A0AAP0C0C9_9ASPA